MGLYYLAISSMFVMGFILGYKFCKFRYKVDTLLEVMKLMSDTLSNNIPSEEALKKIKEIKKELNE